MVSLASNNSISSHGLCSPYRSSPTQHSYSYIAIGRDFASAHASCSHSMSNHPDTCDSLHVTNLALDVVSIAAILHSRSWLIDVSGLFSGMLHGMPLLWSGDNYTHINFDKLLWNYKFIIIQKFTFTEIRPFYKIFILQKFGAIYSIKY